MGITSRISHLYACRVGNTEKVMSTYSHDNYIPTSRLYIEYPLALLQLDLYTLMLCMCVHTYEIVPKAHNFVHFTHSHDDPIRSIIRNAVYFVTTVSLLLFISYCSLIISQWTTMLDIMQHHLAMAGISYTRIDGK